MSILQSCAFLCVCAECFVTLFVSVFTRGRCLTISLRFRSVTLPDSWKIVDELLKITASGHQLMRDSGQDFEVMINMVPGVTRAQAYKGLLKVWHLFASSLRAAFGSIVAQCARVTRIDQQPSLLPVSRIFRLAPTPLEACQTQTRLTILMKHIEISGDAVQYNDQVDPQIFIDGLLTMAHRAHKCSHGLSLIRQTRMPERAVRRLGRG